MDGEGKSGLLRGRTEACRARKRARAPCLILLVCCSRCCSFWERSCEVGVLDGICGRGFWWCGISSGQRCRRFIYGIKCCLFQLMVRILLNRGSQLGCGVLILDGRAWLGWLGCCGGAVWRRGECGVILIVRHHGCVQSVCI
jgi:hypothetical protein